MCFVGVHSGTIPNMPEDVVPVEAYNKSDINCLKLTKENTGGLFGMKYYFRS